MLRLLQAKDCVTVCQHLCAQSKHRPVQVPFVTIWVNSQHEKKVLPSLISFMPASTSEYRYREGGSFSPDFFGTEELSTDSGWRGLFRRNESGHPGAQEEHLIWKDVSLARLYAHTIPNILTVCMLTEVMQLEASPRSELRNLFRVQLGLHRVQ